MTATVVNGNKIRYWDLHKTGWKYALKDPAAFMVPVYPERNIGYPVDEEGNTVEDPFVTLSTEGLLWFRHDYHWDGASGPTFDTKSCFRGTLVHDGLYQLMRANLLGIQWRQKVDELLRDICKQDGMWWWRAELWYRAVRAAAGPAAKPGDDVADTEIEEAP